MTQEAVRKATSTCEKNRSWKREHEDKPKERGNTGKQKDTNQEEEKTGKRRWHKPRRGKDIGSVDANKE